MAHTSSRFSRKSEKRPVQVASTRIPCTGARCWMVILVCAMARSPATSQLKPPRKCRMLTPASNAWRLTLMKSAAGPWNQVAVIQPPSCQTVAKSSHLPASRKSAQFSMTWRILSPAASFWVSIWRLPGWRIFWAAAGPWPGPLARTGDPLDERGDQWHVRRRSEGFDRLDAETGGGDGRGGVPVRVASRGEHPGQRGDHVLGEGGWSAGPHMFEEHEPAGRPENPVDLPECTRLIGNRAQHEGGYDRVEARVGEGERAGGRVDDVDRHLGPGELGGELGAHRSRRLGDRHMARGTVETQVGAGARTDLQDISRNATQQLLSPVRHPAAFDGGGAPVVTRGELTAPARLRRMWSIGTVCPALCMAESWQYSLWRTPSTWDTFGATS